MKRRIFMMMLAVVMVVSITSTATLTAVAAPTESVVAPRFTYISSTAVGIELFSGGLMSSGADTATYSMCTANVTTELQQMQGTTWVTLKSWSKDSANNYAYAGGDYYVAKGHYYRVKATHKAIKSGVVGETVYSYSDIIDYR